MPSYQEILDRAHDARTRIREVPPGALETPLADGRVILDVREENEFKAGHIPGALQLSWLRLETRVAELIPDTSTPILAYCAIGHRSAIAADVLQNLGYHDVVSLEGGLQALQAAAAGRRAA